MPVVDAHVHLLPGRLAEKVRAFFGEHLAERLAYPLDHGEVLDRLAADGVQAVWSLPYAHKAGVADGLNASMADVARTATAVRVIGGATVHPDDEDPVTTFRRATEELGLRVLKLHCSVGDYRPDDPRLDGVWERAAELGVPVVVHAGHDVSGRTEAAELAPVGVVASRHPDARIVIAHCGHRAVDAALDLVERHPHVYADLTPVVDEPVRVPAERLASVAPKLLFGSDAPNTAIEVGDGLTAVRDLLLSDEVKAGILGGTATRLLGRD
jgi:predicted TIM-barrel fold metal-dependent hydrolase